MIFAACAFFAKRFGMLPAYYFAAFVQPLSVITILWIAYDWLDRRLGVPRYPEWLTVMFFVYCMHLIVLSWCGGIIRLLFGTSPMARLFGYFLLWQTFWIDILIANFIVAKYPKLYDVLAGGRKRRLR